jgi:hypothetical protein
MACMTIKYVLAAATLATGIGCGTPSSPTAPDTAVQPRSPIIEPASNTVRSNTVSASNAGVPGVDRFDLAMSDTGTATLTLKWPNGDFSLQLYVTRGECADTTSLARDGCTILGNTRPGTLPGVIVSKVASGDEITVWVLNPDEEPQTFTVDLTMK